MTMSSAAPHAFTPVAKIGDLPDPGRMVVEVDERLLVLVRVGDEYFALDDVCTHDDGPLSDGTVEGYAIACPRHGAKFDLRTGCALTMPAVRATAVHDVEVRGDDVCVRLRHASKSPGERQAAAAAAASIAPLVAAAAPSTAAVNDATASAPAAPAADISEDSLREALKQVVDPELFVNIVDLGLVYNVTMSDRDDGRKHVAVDMTMTSPACPAGPQLLQGSKDALGRVPGVGSVEVKLVMIPPWTPDRMTEAAKDQLGIF